MKKSYSALKTVSTITTICGYVILITGLTLAAFYFVYYRYSDVWYQVYLIPLISAILGLILALPFWAIGQFINLFIDVANNIHTVNENTYFIATSIDKVTSKKI